MLIGIKYSTVAKGSVISVAVLFKVKFEPDDGTKLKVKGSPQLHFILSETVI